MMKNLLRKMIGWTNEMAVCAKYKIKKALLDLKRFSHKAPIASIVFILALVFTMVYSSYVIFADSSDVITINGVDYTRYNVTGDNHGYIYFGTFPKTQLTAAEVTSLGLPSTPDDGKIYQGNDGKDYLYEVTTNTPKYNSNNGWYKIEPIKWQVLDIKKGTNNEDELVLLSESILEARKYDTLNGVYLYWDGKGVAPAMETIGNRKALPMLRLYLNNYDVSNLSGDPVTYTGVVASKNFSARTYEEHPDATYYNKGFLEKAFTSAERNLIMPDVPTDTNWESYDGDVANYVDANGVKDKVRLLTRGELNGNSTYGFVDNTSRYGFVTDYTLLNITYKSDSKRTDPAGVSRYTGQWVNSTQWDKNVSMVDRDGTLNSNSRDLFFGIRPVITINIAGLSKDSGTGSITDPYTFTYGPETYTINVKVNTGEESRGTISSSDLEGTNSSLSGSFSEEDVKEISITATAKEGFAFDGWYKGTELVSSDKTYKFTPNSSINLVAKFIEPLLINGTEYTKWFEVGSGGKSHGYVTLGSYPQRVATAEEASVLDAKYPSPTTKLSYVLDEGEYAGTYLYDSIKPVGQRWYKFEPIVWRILNIDETTNKGYLLSDSVLDTYRFVAYEKEQANQINRQSLWWQNGDVDSSDTSRKEYPWLRLFLNSYDGKLKNSGKANWYLSKLNISPRYESYPLSGENGIFAGFYNIAFNDEEQNVIVSDTNLYKLPSIDGNLNQTDKVRMLSYEEMYDNTSNGNIGSSFGFASDITKSGLESNRVAFGTDYSTINYNYTTLTEYTDPRDGKVKKGQEYWTISTARTTFKPKIFYAISSNGVAVEEEYATNNVGIRPVITVDLSAVSNSAGVGSFASPYNLSTGTDEIYKEELVSDGEINYYPDGYIDENGVTHNGEGDVEVVSLNNGSELKAYIYGNGMAVFEGTDNKEIEVPSNKKTNVTKVAVSNNGFAPKSTSSMLSGMTNLESADLKNLNGTNLDDMSGMFDGCGKLEKVEFSSSLDTSNVDDFSDMFKDCSSLTTLNLESFTISENSTTTDMFSGCTNLEKINVPLSVDEDIEPELPVNTGSSWSVYKADDTKLKSVTALPGKNTNALFSYVQTVPPVLLYEDPDDSSMKYYDVDALYTWDIATNEGGGVYAYYFDGNKRKDGVTDTLREYDGELVIWTDPNKTDATMIGFTTSVFLDGSDGVIDLQPSEECPISSDNYEDYLEGRGYEFEDVYVYTVTPWSILNSFSTHKIKTVQIANETKLSTGEYLFGRLSQLSEINNISLLDTSSVSNMNYMFFDCSSLTSLDLGDNFDTSNVTIMEGMFNDCSNLETLILGDMFTTPVAKSMRYMFKGCKKLESLDLENFTTPNVTNMAGMFDGCSSLETLDVSSFDTSKVQFMSNMFNTCSKLTTLNLSNFNTSNVTNMSYMFDKCNALSTLTFGTNFVTTKVTNMSYMFEKCSSLETLDISSFDTTKVTNMSYMFNECSSLTSLDLGTNFNTSQVGNMWRMFSGCASLTGLDLGEKFDTSQVTDMSSMFEECSSLTSLDLGDGFDTSQVTDMSYMFEECSSLTSLDLGDGFDTSQVTDMFYMFTKCSSLTSLDLGNKFNTSQVEYMAYMFSGLDKMTSFDISNFDMSCVLDASYMFSGSGLEDSAITTITFNNSNEEQLLNTSYTSIDDMFATLVNLKTLDITGFYLTGEYDLWNMLGSDDETLPTKIILPIKIEEDVEVLLPDVPEGYYWAGEDGTIYENLPEKSASNNYISLKSSIIEIGEGTNKKRYDVRDALYSWDISKEGEEGSIFAYYFDGKKRKDGTTSTLREYDGELIIYSNDPEAEMIEFNTAAYKKNGHIELDGGTDLECPFNSSNYEDYLTSRGFIYNLDTYDRYNTPWSILEACSSHKVKNIQIANSTKLSSGERLFAYMKSAVTIDVSKLDVSDVTSFYYTFYNCEKLSNLNLGENFDTASADYMYGMFENCSSLQSLNLGTKFDTSDVWYMNSMFSGCSSLTSLDLGDKFDTYYVEDMGFMFNGCSKLTELDLGDNFDTFYVTNFGNMFEGCSSLTSLDLGDKFYTTGLVFDDGYGVEYMFKNCSSLTSLDLGENFDTENEEYLEGMFDGCSSLTSLDLGDKFDTSNALYMDNMFDGCSSLTELDLSTFTFNSDAYTEDFLKDTSMLTKIVLPISVDAEIELPVNENGIWIGNDQSGPYTTLPNKDGSHTYIYLKSSIIEVGEGDNKKTYNVNDALYKWDISKDGDGSIFAYYFDGNKKKDGVTNTTRTYDGEVVIVSNSQTAEMITFEDACISESYDAEFMVYSRSVTPYKPTSGKTVDDYLTERGFIEIGGYETYTPWSILQQVKGKDIKEINISDKFKVTNGKYLFAGLNKVTSLDLKKIDFTSCSSLNNAFSNMASLTSIDLDVTTTSTLKDLDSMFDYDKALVTVTFGDNFNTSGVTTMLRTFGLCSSLTSLNLAMFDFSDVQTMSSMFTDCKKLGSITFAETINSEDLTNMSFAFNNCQKLSDVSFISKFDTSSVTDVQAMFFNCANLEEINLSDNDFSNVTNARWWFATLNDFAEYAKWNNGYDDINNLTPEQEAQLENNRDYYNDAYKLPTGVDESKLEHIYFNSNKTITFKFVSNSDYSSGFNKTFFGLHNLKDLDLSSFNFVSFNSEGDDFYHDYDLGSITLPTKTIDDTVEVTLPVVADSYWTGYKDGAKVGGKYTVLPYNYNDAGEIDEVRLESSLIKINVGTPKEKVYRPSDATYAWDISDDGITGKVMVYYFAEDSSKGYDGDLIFWSSDPSNKNMRFDYSGWIDGPDYKLNTSLIKDSNYVSYLTDNNFRKLTNNKSIKPWDVLICFGRNTNKIKHVYVANEFVFSKPLSSDNSFFQYMIDVTNFDVSKLDVSQIESINRMFNTCTSLESIDLSSWNLASVKKMDEVFGGCTNLKTVDFGEDFYLPNVVEMDNTFGGCTNLGGGEAFDISAIRTSDSLRSLRGMFFECTNLVGVDFGDGFDTSKLENIEMLFYNCTNLKSADLSFIDTTYVYDYWGLFYDCENLESVDLSGWTLFGERDWESTFSPYSHYNYYYDDIFTGCTSLTSIKVPASVDDLVKEDLPLDADHKWEGYKNNSLVGGTYKTLPDTAGGTIDEIKAVPNIITIGTKTYKPSDALYTWDISKDGDGSIMAYYFDGNKKKDGVTSTLRTYDGEVVIASSSSDAEALAFTTAYYDEDSVSGKSISSSYESPHKPGSGKSVEDYLTERGFINFGESSNLRNVTPWSILQNIKGQDINEVIIANEFVINDASNYFAGLNKAKSIDISKLNLENVTSLAYMFYYCENLESMTLDIKTKNDDNITSLNSLNCMFEYCYNLKTVEIGDDFDTSKVTNMQYMFDECYVLEDLNLESWDLSQVQTMSYMFSYCYKLGSVKFNKNTTTPNLTEASGLFYYCYNLGNVDLSMFALSQIEDVGNMFTNCVSMTEIDLSDIDLSSAEDNYDFFATANDIEEYAKWDGKLDWYLSLSDSEKEEYEESKASDIPPHESLLEHIYFNEDQTFNPDYYNTMFFGLHKLEELDLSTFVFESGKSFSDRDLYHLNSLKSIILPTKTSDDTVVIELPVVEDSYWTGYKGGVKVGETYTTLPFNYQGNGDIDEIRLQSSIITVGEGANKKVYKPSEALYTWDISKEGDPAGSVMAYFFDGKKDKDGNSYSREYKGELVFYTFNDNKTVIPFDDFAFLMDGEKTVGYGKMFTDTLLSIYGDQETLLQDRNFIKTGTITPWSALLGDDGINPVKEVVIANKLNLTSGEKFFAGLNSLKTITGIENLNTDMLDQSDLRNMEYMFCMCSSLDGTLDLSSLDLTNAKSMNKMFKNCYVLDGIIFDEDKTISNVTDMSSMFNYCKELGTINLSMFNTTSTYSMRYMFSGCENLGSVTFGSNFVTSSVSDMTEMFANCKALTSLDLSSFDISASSVNDFITGCDSLSLIKLPNSMTTTKTIPLVAGDKSYWMGYDDSSKPYGKLEKLMAKTSDGKLTVAKLVHDETAPTVTKVESDKNTYGSNKDITLRVTISEELDTTNFADISKDNFYIKLTIGSKDAIIKYDNYELDPVTGDFVLIFKGKTPQIDDEGEFKITNVVLINNGEEVKDLAGNDLDTSSLDKNEWKETLKNLVVDTTGFPISITTSDHQGASIPNGGITSDDKIYFDIDFSDYTLSPSKTLDEILECFTLEIKNKNSQKILKNKTLTLKQVKDGSYPFATLTEDQFVQNKYKVTIDLTNDGDGNYFIEKDDTLGYSVKVSIPKGVLETEDGKNIATSQDVTVQKLMSEGSLTVKLQREGEPDKELIYNKQKQRFEDGSGNEVKFQDGDKIVITAPSDAKITYKQDGDDFETPSNTLTINIVNDPANPMKPYEEIGAYKDGYSVNPSDLKKITIGFVKLIIITEGNGGTVTPVGTFDIDTNEVEITITVNDDYKASIYERNTLKNTLTEAGSYLVTNLKKLLQDLTVKVKFVSTKAPTPPSGGGGGGGGGAPAGPTYTVLPPDEIEVIHKAYMNGYEDHTFRPSENMSREEVATIVARLHQEFTEDFNFTSFNTFGDAENRWSKNYIGFCKMKDLIHGYEDGSFHPTNIMTRAELATLVNNFLRVQNANYESVDLSKPAFSDVDGRWYEESVNKLAHLGILNGYEDGTFRGDNPVSRIEVAIVMNKINHRNVTGTVPQEYIEKITSMFKDITPNRWYFKDVAEAAVDHPENLY